MNNRNQIVNFKELGKGTNKLIKSAFTFLVILGGSILLWVHAIYPHVIAPLIELFTKTGA